MFSSRALRVLGLSSLLVACGAPADAVDAGALTASARDGGAPDAGSADAGAAGPEDGGSPPHDAGTPPTDGGVTVPTQTGKLACADPSVLSEGGLGQTFYMYCTGMSHVWKTTDWVHYADVLKQVTFNLSGMPTVAATKGHWWAPGIDWDASSKQYVMWVSVVDGDFTQDTRSLAVLTSPGPTGPWKFYGFGLKATSGDEHEIDPMVTRGKDGSVYLFWKRYGGGKSSSILGQALNAHALARTGDAVVIMNGYNSSGWELNVRENPAVWQSPTTGEWHLLYSGAHWADDSYATGHAVSKCGALCLDATRGWRITSSGDRGVVQVSQSKGNAHYAHGGIGGAVWLGDDGASMLVSAAANSASASGDTTRYLARVPLKWMNDAPYVDATGHTPPPSDFGF